MGKLNKAIYGLKQASRQFYRHLTIFLKEIGFITSAVEPCLLKHTVRTIFLAVYVNDLLTLGTSQDVDWFLSVFKTKFDVRVESTVTTYIGSELVHEEGKIFLHQRRLSMKLLTDFKHLLGKPVLTPGAAVALKNNDSGSFQQ